MLNNKLLSLFLLVVIAMLALVNAGCARTPEQRAQHLVKHISDELKLDENQQKQLERIKDEFMTKRSEMGKMREEIFEEMLSLMKDAQVDQKSTDSVVEKNQNRTNELIQFFFSKFAEFHAILTPEQREKVIALMEKHKQKKDKCWYRR